MKTLCVVRQTAKEAKKAMLDFTKRSAQRFNLQWQDLPERSGDHWKIEVEMFSRVPMLLIVHEQTLFTLIRRKSEFKTPEKLADEIRLCCKWYRNANETTFGRNNDRRLTGSITERKRMIRILEFSHESINRAEMAINQCPFSYLRDKETKRSLKPFDAVDYYVKGEMPWLR